MMAQAGSSGSTTKGLVSLKRKRISTDDEDSLSMPPSKKSPENKDNVRELALKVLIESSSPDPLTEDEDVGECVTVTTSPLSEAEFTADELLSSPTGILSPLEHDSAVELTPHSNKRNSKHSTTVRPLRKCPFPWLTWADSEDVWKRMCDSDDRSTQKRNPDMFSRHPKLNPRMRAILFDWLQEVCDVYKLHRETFHLTVDYVDRFLANTVDVEKGQLQLLGVASLFIAAKVEEVYPPKIGEFAYVTDGACNQEDILREEVCVLKVLSWSITPITTNEWLNVYMQLSGEARCAKRRLLSETNAGVNSLRGYTFVLPQYSSLEFVIAAQLIDLAVLHVDSIKFPYSVLAAATMAHTFNIELALRVSGYRWEDIEACHKWLAPFVAVLRSEGSVSVVARDCASEYRQRAGGLSLICPDINLDESHRIQVHNTSMTMFDKVSLKLEELEVRELLSVEDPITEDIVEVAVATEDSPYVATLASPLTPPQSDQKSMKDTGGPTPSTSGRGST